MGGDGVDEIANAYALNDDPGLYEGPLSEYPVQIFEIPEDTGLPVAGSSSKAGKNAKAYSYLSVVDGIAKRHLTWPECEARVKGVSGARFKKSTSAADEAEILRGWGAKL